MSSFICRSGALAGWRFENKRGSAYLALAAWRRAPITDRVIHLVLHYCERLKIPELQFSRSTILKMAGSNSIPQAVCIPEGCTETHSFAFGNTNDDPPWRVDVIDAIGYVHITYDADPPLTNDQGNAALTTSTPTSSGNSSAATTPAPSDGKDDCHHCILCFDLAFQPCTLKRQGSNISVSCCRSTVTLSAR